MGAMSQGKGAWGDTKALPGSKRLQQRRQGDQVVAVGPEAVQEDHQGARALARPVARAVQFHRFTHCRPVLPYPVKPMPSA
jgi:hypothetical protein